MPLDASERLKQYLESISARLGGLDAVLQWLPQHVDTSEGMSAAEAGRESPLVANARAGIEALAMNRSLSQEQFIGVEAIINEDLRPAFDVVDGRFTADHPLWTQLQTDAALRITIEAAFPSIGRLELPGHPKLPYGGTGFIVGKGLIMTNRHVAEIFSTGLGDRRLDFLPGARAGIDFLREFNRPTGPTLSVTRVVMIHPYWDMALLAVDGLPTPDPRFRLSIRDARDLPRGTDICVVGYPAFDPRNPASVQNDLFNARYGIKRLQPGELMGATNAASFGKMVRAVAHDCSTLGGNSGSAVFDPGTGEVLALHFGGAYHQQNYAVPVGALAADARVIDAGVEFAGPVAAGPVDWAAWWRRADTESPRRDVASDGNASPKPDLQAPATSGVGSLTARDGAVTVEIPLRVTISLGLPAGSGVTASASGSFDVGPEQTEKLVEPQHDTDYGSRAGYSDRFLDESGALVVPMPEPVDPAVVAPTRNGESILHYQNFSIVMHKTRRLALITASNVTKEPALRKPDPNADYTRKGLSGLGKNDMELWFTDPRLDGKYQLPDVFFTKDRKAFDKGHIVRRDDVAWGETFARLRRANGDSYHVTNCSPQVAGFNRSALGDDNWGDLENHVLSSAASERLCVFAGPVLAAADEVFVGVGDGGKQIRAKIPSRFWKVIVAAVEDGLAAFGFVLEQDLSDVQWEFIVPDAFAAVMYRLADITAMTGVKFADDIAAADQYDTVPGQELVMRGVRRSKKA